MRSLNKALILLLMCISLSACFGEADCHSGETMDVVLKIVEKKTKATLRTMAYLTDTPLDDIDYSIDVYDIKEISHSKSTGKYHCSAILALEFPDLDRNNKDKIRFTVESRGDDGEFYVSVSGL